MRQLCEFGIGEPRPEKATPLASRRICGARRHRKNPAGLVSRRVDFQGSRLKGGKELRVCLRQVVALLWVIVEIEQAARVAIHRLSGCAAAPPTIVLNGAHELEQRVCRGDGLMARGRRAANHVAAATVASYLGPLPAHPCGERRLDARATVRRSAQQRPDIDAVDIWQPELSCTAVSDIMHAGECSKGGIPEVVVALVGGLGRWRWGAASLPVAHVDET
jgi:hypothetical protein